MPLPLAMMIPFMGIQSMVMAKQFGENFQYGKRRISAMSNDEFNKLTPAKLLSNANAELRSQIPLMKESMEDMRQFQTFIVKEFLLTIRSIIDAGLGKLIGLTPTEINQTVQNIEHFLHGHFEGHGITVPPGETSTETVTETNLLHLSLSLISGANDLVLAAWIRNINDYDNQTQTWLLAEKARRERTDEPVVEPPSESQQNTKLNPAFVATLTKKDLEIGGARVRNYKGSIQKWKGTHKFIMKTFFLKGYKWSNGWDQFYGRPVVNLNQADKLVNNIKNAGRTSYVLVFGKNEVNYYLIEDNF